MIYITGDCHGNFERLNKDNFPEQNEMNKEDYLIIGGDFGGVWSKDQESKEEAMRLDWLECRPYTTLFVDGNHENFDRLYDYPVEEWNGGKVHKIRDSVIHLMRGQVFEIDGKKIFTFGGARSQDISGGILEFDDPDFETKKNTLNQGSEPYRINHLSWWEQEMPTREEMEEGRRNLERNNYIVDFIVSHCCSSDMHVSLSGGIFKPDILTEYFEELRQKTKYKKWFFGHYHDNKNVSIGDTLLYNEIIRIL